LIAKPEWFSVAAGPSVGRQRVLMPIDRFESLRQAAQRPPCGAENEKAAPDSGRSPKRMAIYA